MCKEYGNKPPKVNKISNGHIKNIRIKQRKTKDNLVQKCKKNVKLHLHITPLC